LAVDIAMHICANHDIDEALNKYYTKAKQLCQDFDFDDCETYFEKAMKIGYCLATPAAIYDGGINAACAVINKDRVVPEVFVSIEGIVADRMCDNGQFASDVFIAHSHFRYGDWGNLPEAGKAFNEAALTRCGGMVVGLYDTCEGSIRIVNRDFRGTTDDGIEISGALTTVKFSDR
jgi:hypothetical protein